jgi:hypothetical protein
MAVLVRRDRIDVRSIGRKWQHHTFLLDVHLQVVQQLPDALGPPVCKT